MVIDNNDYDYALVAGGSKGIGYAIAEALAKRKFNLFQAWGWTNAGKRKT